MANPLLGALQDTAALRADGNALVSEAEAILAKAVGEKRGMNDDEKKVYDEKLAQAHGIADTIKRMNEMQALRGGNAFQEPNPGQSNPPRRISVHENALDRPWWSTEAISYEQHANETPLERRRRIEFGFGNFLSEVAKAESRRHTSDSYDIRLRALNDDYQKRAQAAGASEQVPADGGFLVYPDFSQEILFLAHETGNVYPRARKLPLSEFTNAIKIPAIDETSRADGSRWGGVQMFWENEADALKGSKPSYQLLEMILKKLTGLYYATNEVLADARLLGAFVMMAFSQELGFKMDDGCINGTGSGQLSGILNAKSLITVNKKSTQATQTIVVANIQEMWARMWGPCRRNAVWFVNQDIEPQLNSLSFPVGTGGIPIYLPPGVAGGVFGGLSAAPYTSTEQYGGTSGTLYGRPVVSIEQCQTLGTAGDIILADMSQYLMIDKGDMQTATSMHVKFLTDEMTYRWIYRTDAQPWWRTFLTPAHGSNTLSPFVSLQTR